MEKTKIKNKADKTPKHNKSEFEYIDGEINVYRYAQKNRISIPQAIKEIEEKVNQSK